MPDNTLRSEGDDLLRSPLEIAQQMFDDQLESAVAQLRTTTKHPSTEWLNDRGVTMADLRDAIDNS